jgi:site-specific DNA recombinase
MLEEEMASESKDTIKQKIRARYKGVDRDILEFIPARPVAKLYDDASYKRVCAYCRVSTGDPHQTTSYELQKNYYEDKINSAPNWSMVGLYADEGISGTSLMHREEFKKMIRDCEAGKIDLILTKSVSRFARNIVDCLEIVRELKRLPNPVGVLFETEGIYTLDGTQGEMMLSVMAMTAQEESQNKSDIMNQSIEMRFSRGIFLTPELLGYDKDADGNLVINEDEADTVRLAYYLYDGGFSKKEVCDMLTKLHRRTGYRKQTNKNTDQDPVYNTRWTPAGLTQMMRNERYCGDVLARKTFTPDFLTHKSKRNNHDRNQYIQRDHHDPIVSREVYDAVVQIMNVDSGKSLPKMTVVDDGPLRGFVSVNRTWRGFTGEDYVNASKSAMDEQKAVPEKKAFLSGFQLVHGEYFYDHKAMSMTISKGLLSFNLNCIRQLQGVKYVELLFNPVDRCMAIRPTDESNPNAIAWCDLKDGKYISRTRSCKGFCQALFSIMGWDSEQRYTFTGRYREFQGEQILIFELADTISYEDVESEGKEKKVAHYTDEDDEEFGGDSVDEEADCLVPEMYTAEWGVLRPARTYKGCYGLSEKKSEELLREAQKIIERIKSQNGGVTESGDNSLGSEGDGARE